MSAKQLPLLSKFLPALRLFFAEKLRELEGRFSKETLKSKHKQEFFENRKKEYEEQKEKQQQAHKKLKIKSC